MHITDAEQRDWLQRRIEGPTRNQLHAEGKKAILNKLIEGEGFEKFAAPASSAPSASGLDGAESTIPRWSRSSSAAANWASKEIGAGHVPSRAAQCAGQCDAKPYRQLFHEFQGGAAILPKSKVRAT